MCGVRGIRGAEEVERGVHQAIRKRNWGTEEKRSGSAKFLCYLGDTSKEIFEGEQWEKITQYKNIMIECTFIKEEDLEQADKTFHIHWKDLEPIVDKYKENNFILIHFSQRYENSWLTEFFKEKKKPMCIHG